MNPSEIIERVRRAGVVGAGGGGFPTHLKLAARVDTVIANAAECEPLLAADEELVRHRAARVLRGLQLAMEATGAEQGLVAIKAKHREAVAALEEASAGLARVGVRCLDDTYPAGDEHVTVYEVLGRVIPPGALPLAVGALVQNVGTLANIAAAVDEGRPVTTRILTIGGAVAEPVTVEVPLGTPIGELLPLAGGPTVDDPAYLLGGIMMGCRAPDLAAPVTKTLAALLVLPESHAAVGERAGGLPRVSQIARYCVQCRQCTDLCPRYLLGHPVEPHRAMRALAYGDQVSGSGAAALNPAYCCECGLCSLFGCFMQLSPRRVYQELKSRPRPEGDRPPPAPPEPQVQLFRRYRRVPTQVLKRRLGLARYDRPAPLSAAVPEPRILTLPLKQHAGVPAEPLVRPGDAVAAGQAIADVPAGQVGARLHAPLAGRVASIGPAIVIEVSRGAS